MKFSSSHILLLAAGLTLVLPIGHTQSQLAPSTDPAVDFQALQTANEDLLKRQDATLKDLTDLTTSANEIRIFSKRG